MKHLTDPFAQLMQEHTSVLLQLKQLQKTARAIRQDGYSTKHSGQFHSASIIAVKKTRYSLFSKDMSKDRHVLCAMIIKN